MNETQTSSTSMPRKPQGETFRIDNWQQYPTLVAIGFGLFGIYATLRAFEGNYFEVGNLLSPFYSPKLEFKWWPLSPALLILPIPLLFRATCYYYRKAYYRGFSFLSGLPLFSTFSPRACGVVGQADPKYEGEAGFPFVLQNIHRYAFYLAAVVLSILWWDAVQTLFEGGHFMEFSYLQVSWGTIVYFANVYLLSGYTFGCHACRHLVGGCRDSFSESEPAKNSLRIWEKVTHLNERHENWAWASLFSVGFADFYTRCVAAGWFADPIIFQLHPHN